MKRQGGGEGVASLDYCQDHFSCFQEASFSHRKGDVSMNRVMHVWVYLALFYRAFVATAIMLRGEEVCEDQEHEIKQQLTQSI